MAFRKNLRAYALHNRIPEHLIDPLVRWNVSSTNIFIKLYLNEDVDILTADLLRVRGFSAITTREANRLGWSDDEQLAFATSKHMTLLTHNRADFEKLAQEYYSAGKTHPSIVLVVRRPPREVVRRLLIILNHVTAGEMQGGLRYI